MRKGNLPPPSSPQKNFDSMLRKINYILKLFFLRKTFFKLFLGIYILTTFRKIYTPMFTILFLIFAKKICLLI